MSRSRTLSNYLDLVSIGTVSDMAPLTDENRIFVSLGLKVLADTRKPGLRALKEAAGIKPGPVAAYNIGFGIGPRINAAGRVGTAKTALELLVTDDYAKAKAIAATLEKENTARRRIEADILAEAIEMIEGGSFSGDMGFVLASADWHPGVIGIVASRLVERYSKPVVMIAIDDAGSARVRRAPSGRLIWSRGFRSAKSS